MPENDFEKQVQQLFDELRLTPSAEVWPNVSSRIQKGKGRKRVLIWLPLALLLLSTGGFLLMQNNGSHSAQADFTKSLPASGSRKENSRDVQPLQENRNSTLFNSKKNTDIPASSADGNGALNAGSNTYGSGSDSHASKELQHSVKPPVNSQASGNVKQQAHPAAQLPVPDHAGKLAAVNEEKNKLISQSWENTKKETGDSKGALLSSDKNPATTAAIAVRQSVDLKVVLLPAIESERRLNGILKSNVPENISNTSAHNTEVPVKLMKKKVWEWGISGGAGVAAVSPGLSDLFGNSGTEKSSRDVLYGSPNMSINVGLITGQNSLVAALPPPPSVIKKGLTWQVGGFAKRKITSRLSVTGGLQYSYYSTNRVVGSDINNYRLVLDDTHNANARYAGNYIGGQITEYTSRYHFIEIPAGVQWQFNKSVKLPLQLNAGLSLSYLVSTTALHYHAKTGSYYKDKALFNKMQTGVYAGLSAKLFANSRRPLYIGPAVQYNLTNLLKPSVKLDQHFTYAGLKAEWVLGKK